ncbi:MAG: M28 family peptidase [Acidobacteriota bacterium]
MARKLAFLLTFLIFLGLSSAQENTRELLAREVLQKFAGETSGKICLEHIRDLSVFNKWYGSSDMERAAAQIAAKAERYGLRDVRIEKFPVDEDTYYGMQKPWYAWNCDFGELRMIKPHHELISSYEANASCVLVYSRDSEVEAEVVYVGRGIEQRDYEGKDVKGKLVLATGNPDHVSKIAIFEKDAAGILSALGSARPGVPPTEVYQTTIRPWNDDRTKLSTFGFSLSSNQAKGLVDLLHNGEKVILRAKVKAQLRVPGYHPGVTAVVRGTTFPDEEIIFTAHLDHPRPGAHDNNSGCAVLLEVARLVQALVDQKIIEPPKRTLRFYWTPHVWGCDMLFETHPELFRKTIANINVDCVGLDQAKISSALTVVSPPFSRASYLPDVFNNFLNYVTLCSNSDMGRASYGPEIIDHDGSANVFHGRVVPWVDYSDHIFFNSGSVGIPGVMLIDLPFGSHHSQNDKFDLLDPTQLKRVAFLAAVSAYTIASAGPEEAAAIIDEVRGGGTIRLEADLRLAKSLLRRAEKASLSRRSESAQNLLRHAFARERQALSSTRIFVKNDKEASLHLTKALKTMEAREKEWREELGLKAAEAVLTEIEKRLAASIPLPNPALKGTLGILNSYPADKYQYPKFSPMSAYFYELLNYMDGKRTLLEAIRAVEAECLSSHYQVFSPEDALEFAEALKRDGVISYQRQR